MAPWEDSKKSMLFYNKEEFIPRRDIRNTLIQLIDEGDKQKYHSEWVERLENVEDINFHQSGIIAITKKCYDELKTKAEILDKWCVIEPVEEGDWTIKEVKTKLSMEEIFQKAENWDGLPDEVQMWFSAYLNDKASTDKLKAVRNWFENHKHDRITWDEWKELKKILGVEGMEKGRYRCPDITRLGMCPFTGKECTGHEINCIDRPKNKCPICGEQFDHINKLSQHVNVEHPNYFEELCRQ